MFNFHSSSTVRCLAHRSFGVATLLTGLVVSPAVYAQQQPGGDLPQVTQSGEFDCRPYVAGNDEVCTHSTSGASVLHVGIHGYSDFEGATVSVGFPPQCTADPNPDSPEPPAPPQSNDGAGAQQGTFLTLHNDRRADHCAAPLVWSDELAASAWFGRWARTASTGASLLPHVASRKLTSNQPKPAYAKPASAMNGRRNLALSGRSNARDLPAVFCGLAAPRRATLCRGVDAGPSALARGALNVGATPAVVTAKIGGHVSIDIRPRALAE